MTCILELNDTALTLYRDTSVLHRSPGIAVVLDDDVRFGEEALHLSRIHPRQANQQYFTRLNADPLPAPGKRARNHADLVYLHLSTFKPFVDAQGGEVLLAVPGILSPDQLGVLLGVLQEVGIRVCGFVDAAVAAMTTQSLPERSYHLDVMLQRAVITTVETEHGGSEVGKVGAQEVLDCGLNRLLEGWINVIADRFVRETRFDPLHAAATEQQLFNQVYDWVAEGAGAPELIVEIVHGDHSRRVELGRGVLEEKAEQRFRTLADAIPSGGRVYLSARSARMPGLRRALEALQVDAVTLPDDALPRGCLDHLGSIVPADGELRLVTRLPHGGRLPRGGREPHDDNEQAPAGEADVAPPGPPPTHALQGHEAWPLTGELPFRLTSDQGRVWLQPEGQSQLNGETLERPQAIRAGDRLLCGGREYLFIRVNG